MIESVTVWRTPGYTRALLSTKLGLLACRFKESLEEWRRILAVASDYHASFVRIYEVNHDRMHVYHIYDLLLSRRAYGSTASPYVLLSLILTSD